MDKIIYPGVYPNINLEKPISYNYNFSKYFSAAGIANIETIDKDLNVRQMSVKYYIENLNKNLLLQDYENFQNNSFLEFPILLQKNTSKQMSKKLLNKGYDIRHTWYVNSSSFFNENENLYLKNCDKLEKYLLCLPTNNNFNFKDIKNICEIINFSEK